MSSELCKKPDMAKKDIRLQLVISPEELAALDAWRQKHAVWSRSEAIRQAVQKMVASASP